MTRAGLEQGLQEIAVFYRADQARIHDRAFGDRAATDVLGFRYPREPGDGAQPCRASTKYSSAAHARYTGSPIIDMSSVVCDSCARSAAILRSSGVLGDAPEARKGCQTPAD